MSSVTLSTQTQTVDLEPKRETPPPSVSKFSFAEVKKGAVWAWEASVEKLKAAPGSLQSLLKRVSSFVYEFFASKLQSTKNFLVSIPDTISLKLGSRAYAPRIAALEAQLAQMGANQQPERVAANVLPPIQEEVRPIFPAHDEAIAPVEAAAPMLKAEEPAPTAAQDAPKKEAEKPMNPLSYLFFWNYKK